MKIKRYIIKPPQATGRRSSLTWLITVWLLLDRIGIPDWGWGIYGTLATILIGFYLYDLFTVDEIMVDIQKSLKKQYQEKMTEEVKEV